MSVDVGATGDLPETDLSAIQPEDANDDDDDDDLDEDDVDDTLSSFRDSLPRKVLPVGTYPLAIESATYTEVPLSGSLSGGQSFIALNLRVTKGPRAGKLIVHRMPLSR